MRFAPDGAQANDLGFRNAKEIGRFKPVFLSFCAFFWRALRAQDGLLPCSANNCFLASTRFARPNRLSNCAVFLTRPL